MKAYSAFAYVYDRLMEDVDYKGWVKYIENIFERYNIKPQYMVELACGTGNVTNLLAQKGYHLIGVDISEDMLTIAQDKAARMEKEVIYLNQDMRDLELPTELDVILCVCDGFNYILKEEDLENIFKLVHYYLKDSGLFIFDLSSYYKLSQVLGKNTYAENLDEVSYIWENDFNEKNNICDFDLTLFIKEGQAYRKYVESHRQRAYRSQEIENMLQQASFKKIQCFDAFTFSQPKEESERIYFVCEK